MAASSPRLLKPGQSIDAEKLMTLKFSTNRVIVRDLLYVGLSILASRPKEGKSFLAIKLGMCLALGISFLGHAPAQCSVLILALEDTLDRLQDRLRLMPHEKSNNLHFATASDGLPTSIFQEMDLQLSLFPDIRLVVIDTLQKIRHRTGDIGYNADYEDLGALKEYADERGIAILLLHHTRKSDAETEYDRISGTTGITGVADTMMVLSRKDNDATLLVKGREFEERKIPITFNEGNWTLIDESVLAERAYAALPEAIKRTIVLMDHCDRWRGTCKELTETLSIEQTSERALSQQLRDHTDILQDRGIHLCWSRSNRGSMVTLAKRRQVEQE